MDKVKRTPALLHKLVKEFELEVIVKAPDYDTQVIKIADVNRPALQLVGFYDYFDSTRLQIFGKAEMTFLDSMEEDQRRRVFDRLLQHKIPALIIARNMPVYPELIEMAEKHERTLLRSDMRTVDISARVIDYLSRQLAPHIMRHGVLMNVNGQGVLILGESGIGKSETAIELLKRGHQLVADDAVEIRRVSTFLYGEAPEMIRHYIEIRGVGVIDVRQLFGMVAVQSSAEIDMVIEFEPWQEGKFYDRLGLGEETYTILGVKLPYVLIPVRPGRNMAGIVEIAAMKNRQIAFGNNPAEAFINQMDRYVDQLAKEANEAASQAEEDR